MPYRYDAIELFDLGYGPRLISVTPPDCDLAPGTKIIAKDRGKAPGYPTDVGWIGASVNDPNRRCHDYFTAKVWDLQWGANVGFVVGQGVIVLDNDQGEEFSRILRALMPRAPRRIVLDPKHKRDAFVVRVVDGDSMEPEDVANLNLKFHKGLLKAELQVFAKGHQVVFSGVHPGARMPYAWENELPPLDQIPPVTLLQLEAILAEFEEQACALGWERTTRKAVSAPVSAPPATIVETSSPLTGSDALDEAEALLAQIPNRDIEPSKANDIDKWLDESQNWLSVGYAFAAFAPALRHTPKARAIWRHWSDGRFQKDWPSDKVWASIISQDLRYGATALLDIVRQFKRAAPDFPDLDPEEFPPDPPKASKPTPIWDELKSHWAFCGAKGFIYMPTGRVWEKTAFADREAYRAKALCRELGIKGNKQVNAANAFLRQPDRIEVFDITYAPGDGPFVVSKDTRMSSFNHWKATTILAEPVAKNHIQKWLDHLSFVLGSDAERDRFLRWCAFVAQHPKLKPNWHFLIISDAGLGKDTMTLPLKLAVGKGNHTDITSNALGEPFNGWWAERKLVIIGEFTKARNTGEVNNRLKPLLAAPPDEMTVNQKNMKQYEIPNRTAVIMFSNAPNPLYLERGSRRVHVVNRLNQKARDADYYTDIINWLDGGGAGPVRGLHPDAAPVRRRDDRVQRRRAFDRRQSRA